jgi:transposase
MADDASIFWENVKKEIKSQNTTHEWVAKNSGISFNTFQGWISKGIYPRVNEAIRIAVSLSNRGAIWFIVFVKRAVRMTRSNLLGHQLSLIPLEWLC